MHPDPPCFRQSRMVSWTDWGSLCRFSRPSALPARAAPCVDARMTKRIEDEQISPLRQRRQHGKSCDISGSEKQRGFRAKEFRGLGLETLVLLAIAAQQPRPAGPDRGAGPQARGT